MDHNSSRAFVSNSCLCRRDDFSFHAPPFPSSSSCNPPFSVSSPCPTPSTAFYSSPSVHHSSRSIDVTIRPPPLQSVWDFDCFKNDRLIFLENLNELLELNSLDGCEDVFKSEDLGLDNWAFAPSFFENQNDETASSIWTIGEGVIGSPEDKDISDLSFSDNELGFPPSGEVHWSPRPLPDLVSPRTPRTVTPSAPGLHLAKSGARSSPSFCNATFALESPKTSELTLSGSSELHFSEPPASDGDSVSSTDKNPLDKTDPELPETGTVLITVKSDDLNLDDGYVWRKYGEKSIKHRVYRRSYFRCGNAGCPVRKKTERASDKYVYMTYTGGRHNHYV